MSSIDNLLDPIAIPGMVRVSQRFERPVINDVIGEFRSRLTTKGIMGQIKSGQKIAIAVGSRGIANLPAIVKALVEEIKKAGAEPFLVPAMGSHGGATAEGQRAMLTGLGFSEKLIGAPIRATMETVQIGVSENGYPVFFDKHAFEADATIIVNRIKPHTAFRGDYESGLLKLVTIGLGKQKGADICHDLGFGKMAENIPAMAKVSLARANILFAVGLVENAYHETCRVEILANGEIVAAEPAMLLESKRLCPRIYFDRIDAMIIDEIGKDISGSGLDTNVLGRYHTPFCSGGPEIAKIAVLDITAVSHGNANGLGIADFTTQRVFDKISFENTYPNSLTTTVSVTVKIPMVLKNDKQAVQACIKTCNKLDKKNVTVVRIKNTLALDEILVSENLVPIVRNSDFMAVVEGPFDMSFNSQGNLF